MRSKKKLPPLSDHLCFSLYATSRAIQRLYHPALEKNGLTYPQYLILVTLYDLETLPLKELGEKLDLSSNTLTPLLKRMEQHGLVERLRSTEDERVVRITITDLGKAKREESYDLPNILLNHSSLTSEEMNELIRLIGRLYEDTRK
ncbi:MarR family winged helix-turn-helix transcriptional regulator [Listeria kieliensis]|uniref:MarR family transcriptional regulator n=1 Tax=Listeria kieliensis TaxID=1621700 RepID=A0A3D8TTK0_9LIST|nr:MarR family transcriptional regulator [Listeria kieliensis]RDX01146.1 MarR family transcriptional regulator [Listeria kieliensis]